MKARTHPWASASCSPGTRRREAARAVFDALPLLRQAESVSLVQIDPASETERNPSTPCPTRLTAMSSATEVRLSNQPMETSGTHC